MIGILSDRLFYAKIAELGDVSVSKTIKIRLADRVLVGYESSRTRQKSSLRHVTGLWLSEKEATNHISSIYLLVWARVN